MRWAASTALTALLTLSSPVALAQPAADRGDHGGWRELLDPERRQGLHYRQAGLIRLVQGLHRDAVALDSPPWVLLDQALLRFERARRRIPDDPELAYYTAYALTAYESPAPDGGTERRTDEAVEAWQRVRELDPTFFPDRVALELASLHMRRLEFAEARAEFEIALRSAVPPTVDLLNRFFLAAPTEVALAGMFGPASLPTLHGNLAEAAMLTGDLDAAVEHYRAARAGADNSVTRSLAQWGLAVALDRSGAHEDAVGAARRAVREDPLSALPMYQNAVDDYGNFAVLHIEGVFFEPRWEIRAYEALGHEALGHPEDGPADPDELRRALVSWRYFLAEGGVASRYAPMVRRNIERLERELGDAAQASGSR